MLVLLVILVFAPLTQGRVRLDDNSDWWSIMRDEGQPRGIKVQEQKAETPESNFKILGADLGYQSPTAKLGQPTTVERGDAGNFRSQACYTSLDGPTTDSNRVYLVFEYGEVTSAFYLFAGGPPWSGSDVCLKSRLVSRSTRTGSGLRLGMSTAEIKRILGEPSSAAVDRLVYSRVTKEKTSPEHLKMLRMNSTAMAEEELQRNAFWDVTVYIEARFSNDKMIYLGVLRVETL